MIEEIKDKQPAATAIEVWFQDEARVGQKGTLTRRWAPRGSRPRAIRDHRFKSAYLFGAVCPDRDLGASSTRSITLSTFAVAHGTASSPNPGGSDPPADTDGPHRSRFNGLGISRPRKPKESLGVPHSVPVTTPFPLQGHRHMFGSSEIRCLEVGKEGGIAALDDRCRQGAHEDITGAVGADKGNGESGKRNRFGSAFETGDPSAARCHDDGLETR